jgi:hypothetical protein
VAPLEKPAKQRVLPELVSAIFDRRLYGTAFFTSSVPLLILTFSIQMLVYVVLKTPMMYVYIPLFVMLVMVSAFGSKNMTGREVHSMGHFRVFLFSIVSVMASLAPFTVNKPSDPWLATAQFLFLYGISTIALTVAVVEITVYGQRISLRNSMKLDSEFFKKQKKIWAEKLSEFPNSDNIVSSINEGKAVPQLFDRGLFGLAVLWSWAVMEQTLDAVAEGVISREPAKREIFRHKNGFRRAAVEQMENLGFCPNLSENKDGEQITLKDLYSIRNDFAHRSVLPTFQQTFETMATLKSFVEEMPEILQGLKVGEPVQH